MCPLPRSRVRSPAGRRAERFAYPAHCFTRPRDGEKFLDVSVVSLAQPIPNVILQASLERPHDHEQIAPAYGPNAPRLLAANRRYDSTGRQRS
jgi:hypothetical protein